jgi:glycosyltransferase involved in cell wall biosynthesis
LVEWWGRRDDMPAIMAAAHIVCLPSTYGEGVPKVLIEAAASGRPIVATDIPGCREIVVDGKTGFLVPPGNPEALAHALERLARNAPLRHEQGLAARQMAEAEFDVRSVVKKTLGAYAALLHAADRRKPPL